MTTNPPLFSATHAYMRKELLVIPDPDFTFHYRIIHTGERIHQTLLTDLQPLLTHTANDVVIPDFNPRQFLFLMRLHALDRQEIWKPIVEAVQQQVGASLISLSEMKKFGFLGNDKTGCDNCGYHNHQKEKCSCDCGHLSPQEVKEEGAFYSTKQPAMDEWVEVKKEGVTPPANLTGNAHTVKCWRSGQITCICPTPSESAKVEINGEMMLSYLCEKCGAKFGFLNSARDHLDAHQSMSEPKEYGWIEGEVWQLGEWETYRFYGPFPRTNSKKWICEANLEPYAWSEIRNPTEVK